MDTRDFSHGRKPTDQTVSSRLVLTLLSVSHTPKSGNAPFDVVIGRFICWQHCPYPTGLFNHQPQSKGLGSVHPLVPMYSSITAATITGRRLVNLGLSQDRDFSHGLLTSIIDIFLDISLLKPCQFSQNRLDKDSLPL